MIAEILAPAGSPESLLAAVRCGANAVYLGGKAFNARRSAANFNGETLRDAVKYCHARNVRVYLALNTLVFDDEQDAVSDAVRNACEAGIDALIVQDLGVAGLVRESAPDMPLHASTQMSVHDSQGAKVLERLGFSRVVLARELSRNEIHEIKSHTVIELECFVHGALCVCVSGQCFFSAMLGGRSGNRGLCAQPCRLPVSNGKNEYALSLKDLSLIERIPELLGAGVTSLKIEGRMKRPEYVAAAVIAVRKKLEGEAPDMDTLGSVFSRDGFTSGYFDGATGPGMFGKRRREDVIAANTTLLNGIAASYREEKPLIPAALSLTLKSGVPATLSASDNNGHFITITGGVPEPARTAPTTSEKVTAALSKTGGTPFFISEIATDIGEGLMLPASALNALRRDTLAGLFRLKETTKPRAFDEKSRISSVYRSKREKPGLRVRLSKLDQLTSGIANNAELIIIAADIFSQLDGDLLKRLAHKLAIETPRVLFGKDQALQLKIILEAARKAGIGHASAGNIGSIGYLRKYGFKVYGDFSLNITNTNALTEYEALGLYDATLSLELTKKRIASLGGEIGRGIVAYGFLPLMIMRNCPVASAEKNGCPNTPDSKRQSGGTSLSGDCTYCRRHAFLTDRRGNKLAVSRAFGASEIFNCVPLFLADKIAEFSGIDFTTLHFTSESPQECDDIVRLYMTGDESPTQKTRGLYYRGVD